MTSAWLQKEAPLSVIAALGDDLDEQLGQRPRIGLVAAHFSDLGLVGGNWYVEHDRDDLVGSDTVSTQVRQVERLLASGYGADDVPDLLGVTLQDGIGAMDAALGRMIESAERASGGSFLVVVTATGSTGTRVPGAIPATEVRDEVERAIGEHTVEAMAQGGLFLNQEAVAASGRSDDRVVAVLRDMRTPSGERVFADAFPALAVTFARYC